MSSQLTPSYPLQSVSYLSPGPQRVSFNGIVINIASHGIDGKSPQTAKGYIKLLIHDCGGDILVKLWYADHRYDFQLGQGVKVATTHISPATSNTSTTELIRSLPTSIMTSIFPEKDSGCSIEVSREDKCAASDTYSIATHREITSLHDLFETDNTDKFEGKILVAVLDIGPPTTITTKANTAFETIELTVIDHSSLYSSSKTSNPELRPAYLSLTSALFTSASSFVPNQTTLLISRPKLLSPPRRRMKLTLRSKVFVDPSCRETEFLRNWTNRLFPTHPTAVDIAHTNRQSEGYIETLATIFDKQAQSLLPRKQYTLALFLDEIQLRHQRLSARPPWRQKLCPADVSFVGYISVLITRIALVELYDAERLFCGFCSACKIDLFSNIPIVQHPCSRDANSLIVQPRALSLSWNPSLLAGISDETGGFQLNPSFAHDTAHERHNITLTEQAVYSLTGLRHEDLIIAEAGGEPQDRSSDSNTASPSSPNSGPDHNLLQKLQHIESHLLWSRITLVMGWTTTYPSPDAGRSQISSNDKQINGQDRVVVLDVIS